MLERLFSWVRKPRSAPRALTDSSPVVQAKPLWEQFQRIGGGVTPLDVTNIIREADSGQPARFVDLVNESRQKDGHMHCVMATRDRAVSLVDFEFIEPEDANRIEKKAVALCRRIRDEFRNWPLLITHLTASYGHGHATAELRWEKTSDGLLLPVECKPIHTRDFIFSSADGCLRYRRHGGDTVGADLLAENPGRIIQLQRRIVGDVPVREGLARVLVWAALFRNWDLRDWIALGEIGWKPWRIGKYPPGTNKNDIDQLIAALERIGSQGAVAIPDTTNLDVQWPKGFQSNTSTHRELFDTLGREMSKAVIGQTTTTEAGPNGDRASTETRDEVRLDIREEDCCAVAAVLRYHLFMPALAANLGNVPRIAAGVFQTEEQTDRRDFAQAVKLLRDSGLRIPAKWVRDELGMPEPVDGEELLQPVRTEPDGGTPPGDDAQEEDPAGKEAA